MVRQRTSATSEVEQAGQAEQKGQVAEATQPRTQTGADAPTNDSIYFNRELSWLEFNSRVLDESLGDRHPLLERIKFLAIFHSNLDEFFMVRISGILRQYQAGVADRSPDGMTPADELLTLRSRTLAALEQATTHWQQTLCPALAQHGIQVLEYRDLNREQRRYLKDYFDREIFPVCTPLAVDPGHPFPHISNLSLNLAVNLEDPDGGQHFARVKVPLGVISRLLVLPPGLSEPTNDGQTGPIRLIWLEQVLAAHLSSLFPSMEIVEAHPFRVTRDADVTIQELEADDLLETIEESINRRRFGSVVALFVNPTMPANIRSLLIENLEVTAAELYVVEGALGLSDLMEVYKQDRAALKDPSLNPLTPPDLRGGNIFDAIKSKDILLHHPFDSFNPVVEFIRQAATDPQVLAIKQTLYRVGSNSPIVGALLEAAEYGKQVAVLVELKARFDEENNIEWARALEQAGVHVTYGLIGLKTHCKVALVVRKERDGIHRYLHIGSGNYNPSTSRLYTDLGLFTCNEHFGADASDLFNFLTGYSKQTYYRKFLVAPVNLRQGIRERILREIASHRQQGGGRLIFKMNALVDPALIEDLYAASAAGVQVDLIIRGICCLRPGVAGLSENIRVVSIVGRFLEHSRIYYFANGGDSEVYFGSADLMPRNLDYRVEVLVPVENAGLKGQILHDFLELYLRDNVSARLLQPDGSYLRRQPAVGEPVVDSQYELIRHPSEAERVAVELARPKSLQDRYGRVDTTN